MNTCNQCPFYELIHAQEAEVEKYKWIESQKRGYDIGWEAAKEEWLDQHFPAWKDYSWHTLLDELLPSVD